MTNEEAIKVLRTESVELGGNAVSVCRFLEALDMAVKALDAVPVVRCRECNHCDPENYHCDHPMSTAAPLRRKPDDFCSYGERKEGADNG